MAGIPGWAKLAVAVCGVAGATLGNAQTPSPDRVAKMQELVQSYARSQILADKFWGSVLVAQGDTVLLSQGYGKANAEWDIPDAPDTKFRLGSLTKQFTAASILLLEERGKLNTDDLVKKYVPDAPPAWDKITIYEVLTHTSGIPNFTEFPDYHDKEWKPTTPAELVARFENKWLDFDPGSNFHYSNSGYVLLGYILEKVSGEPYAKFVQENLFGPLGMTDTGVDRNVIVLPHLAQGYEAHTGDPKIAGYIDMTVPFSAGDLYSTTEDLLKWERGLFGGKLLTPASLKKMTTPNRQDYGFGLEIVGIQGHRAYTHNGGIEGFTTSLTYLPDEAGGPVTVIVLSNLGRAVEPITQGLEKLMFGMNVELAPTAVTPAPKN
jgi:CubicO group peptidase (beta-lactamase class C family)